MTTTGDIFGVSPGRRFYWRLVGRGQGCCQASYSARGSPSAKGYLVQNSDITKVKKQSWVCMEDITWTDWWISYTRNKPRVVPTFVALVSRTFSTFFFQIYIFKSYYILLLFSRSVIVWLCDPVDCSTPGFPVLQYLLEFAQTHVHWVSDAIQSSHPLLPSSSPALNLSQWIHWGKKWKKKDLPMVFSSELALHIRWPKYWSFSFSISPSNEYSGLISLGFADMISLLRKGLLSLLQHHS